MELTFFIVQVFINFTGKTSENKKGSPLEAEDNKKNGNIYSIHSGLGSVFFEYMKKYRNRIFQYVAETDETDTYGEVLTRCIRTAIKLREKGLNEDDIVSSCTRIQRNNVVPLIASLFIGAKISNFDPGLSHLDTAHLLQLIKPKIVFVDAESLPFMEKCMRDSNGDTELVVFGESEKYSNFTEYLQPQPEEHSFQPVVIKNNKETAFVMCSSGTTGLPKGICISHYGLLGNNLNNDPVWSVNDDSVLLWLTTFYWVGAIMMLIKCVTNGCARLCSEFDAVTIWRAIEKYKVTNIFLVPPYAKEFFASRQKNVDTSSLKSFLMSGSIVTVELMKDLCQALPYTKVLHGYGQTEAGFISIFDVNNPCDIELLNRKPLSSGKVLAVFTWKVVDPSTEKILGPNERGEFRYKCEYQMTGYYKIDSSSAYDSDGYIKSGDIVYYDDEGCLFIVDRIKDAFKYKIWHIIPSVIENVLLSHPAVKEAVVIGVPIGLDGDLPKGVVVLNKGYEDVAAQDIADYVKNIVPDVQKLRAGVTIVDHIPKTPTGKLRRREIRELVLSGEI